LNCRSEVLPEAEEWLAGRLDEATRSGAFRGLRVEEGTGGEAVRLVLTFKEAAARNRFARLVREAARPDGPGESGPPLQLRELTEEPDRDWVAEVAATVRAIPLGRGYAALPGSVPAPPGRQPIHVPRTRAFGTGEHPTTRLAAAMVEDSVPAGGPMLDVGAGTGILAAVALFQGAPWALALDSDPVAMEVARRMRSLNGLAGLHLLCGTLDAVRPGLRFGTVAANIERDALLGLLPALARLTAAGGSLILSGLLREQAGALAEAGRRRGLEEAERRREGEWEALLLRPRAGLRPRVLVEPGTVVGGEVRLANDEAHHLLRVRRLRPGAPLVLLDGRGRCWSGVLQSGGDGAMATDLEEEFPETEAGLETVLLQAILHESGRMETVIRQATELGVARIVPVVTSLCQRGNRRLRQGADRRWQRIAATAVKQCGRLRIPDVESPRSLDEALQRGYAGRRLMLDPGGRASSSVLTGAAPAVVELLVGPEGGLTPEERHRAVDAGFQPVRLGPRTLRADTAAAAALTAVMGAWGDLSVGPGDS
jgi:16S rRNA (uracil1498-N3)-methyltransferase